MAGRGAGQALEVAHALIGQVAHRPALEAGEVFVKHNPARRVLLTQVAGAAYQRAPEVILPATIAPGLEVTRTYDPPHQVFGNGAHVAVVRIDPETALVKVEAYYIVEDCGTILDHDVVVAGADEDRRDPRWERRVVDPGPDPVRGQPEPGRA